MEAIVHQDESLKVADGTAEAALFKAVTDGNLAQVKVLLPYDASSTSSAAAAVANVNVSDSAGFTPLIVAARNSSVDIVSYLLQHPGINVNERTAKGNTALFYAAGKKSVEVVRLLMENGANFFLTNDNQDNVLMCAALGASEEIFAYLVKVFHEIRTAKLPANQHKPWESGKGYARKFFTTRNDDGLTVLMCAVMGGSSKIVQSTLFEVRHELGIHIPTTDTPSVLKMFYPSIFEGALPALNFNQHHAASASYRDPSPPAFLTYVNAANVMGDCALHIAAQNQNVDLYLGLLENSGADPMKVNRRGKRTFELFDTAPPSKITEVIDGEEETPSAAAEESSSSSKESIQDRVTDRLESILNYQRQLREEYKKAQALVSEKLFTELMEEEESSIKKGANKKKNGKQQQQQQQKGKQKQNAASASPTIAPEPTPASESSESENSDSDEEDSDIKSNSAAVAAQPGSTVPATSSSPKVLSVAAPPFIPLAELAAIDAAAGWETVSKQPKKKDTSAAAAAATAPVTAAGAKSKKKTSEEVLKSPKRNKKEAAAAAAKAKTQSKSTKKVEGAAASKEPIAAASVSSPSLPSTARAAWKPTVPASAIGKRQSSPPPARTATFATDSVVPALLTSDSAANFSLSSPASSSSSSSASIQLNSLTNLFQSLHPHIESTDLQLDHFLGAHWSNLSLSQLSTLDEVYAALSRQIREQQFMIFQAQQQEMLNELIRTKSEVSNLRKEVKASSSKTEAP